MPTGGEKYAPCCANAATSGTESIKRPTSNGIKQDVVEIKASDIGWGGKLKEEAGRNGFSWNVDGSPELSSAGSFLAGTSKSKTPLRFRVTPGTSIAQWY